VAVTQQLARITGAQLARCRECVDELDRVCSFTVALPADHLDLDWAPDGLLKATRPALDEAAVAAVRRALDGDEEINPAYRDRPGSVWEHPVTALDPAAVAVVAAQLRRIDPVAVTAVRPDEQPGPDYLLTHFTALRAFYDGAAGRRLATVLWWD
jgi:hypothetical protein